MNEKISNKLLAISIAFSFSIIALFCIFCIGLNRVEAKSYTWSSPEAISFSTSSSFNTGLLQTCTFTNQCNYNDGNYVADYIQYRYPVATNSSNSDTTIKPDKYEVAFRMRIVGLDYLTSDNLKIKLYYFPNQSNNYGVATCDGGETTQIVYNNNTEEDVYIEYKCEVLNVTGNISYLGVVIGNTPNTLYFTQVSQNLSLRGPELTEEDVINNNNANTDKVIQNQDNNTDKITQNQDKNQQQTNEGLQDIEDAITDDTAPNLDAFNDMSGWLPPGPLDSILNIPLNILNGLVGAFNNNTCLSISIPIPFIGGTLDLPCLYNLYSTINGLSIALTTFFTAIAGYLMFKYLSNLYVWIDQTLKMEENSYMRDWGGV